MADLSFASFLQGPLGEAIITPDGSPVLAAPTFKPTLTVTGLREPRVEGADMPLLGPGDVTGLAPGTVIRTDPPPDAVDVAPNYMAVAEVIPPELPWVLTPARAAGQRLRPWFVLVVVEDATTPVVPGSPLPTIQVDVGELPDLSDSWAWAHVQRITGTVTLAGGGEASAAAVARLVCPRQLEPGTTYRACLVPAFASGVAAGLGKRETKPHEVAWTVGQPGPVELPVYHHWRFTTGQPGDFEQLVTRLKAVDEEELVAASVRPVDIRQPWPDLPALAEGERAQLVGVQGALVPFTDPPPVEQAAENEVLDGFEMKIVGQLDTPADLVDESSDPESTGALTPPLYGARHIFKDRVGEPPAWIAGLNLAVANRVAAGLGASYVRANQEDLMAKAWQQVGAIREANRLRATVELTSDVAARVHERHIDPLEPGEIVALCAPASERTRTSDETTLAMETRMSRMADGMATAAFARRVRPAGKLARRTGVTTRTSIPRALAGDVTVPAPAPVIPDAPMVVPTGLPAVTSEFAAQQLVTMTAMASVAALNATDGADRFATQLRRLELPPEVSASMLVGTVSDIAPAIASEVASVSDFTGEMLADMQSDEADFGSMTALGVPIPDEQIRERVVGALEPGDSHHARLESQTSLPERMTVAAPGAPVMAHPRFPAPTALALLESAPEWFMPGLGKVPNNTVALLQQNANFIESYLVGMNHEMMRELLWRDYPTDQRGTPFRRFWPRVEDADDIPGIDTWSSDELRLGGHLADATGLTVVLVRGDVVRRFPGMVVTAVPAATPPEDPDGRPQQYRPDPDPVKSQAPIFAIKVDDATMAYAFEIPNSQVEATPTPDAPGWFFVFAEHGYRIRFGFDIPPEPPTQFVFDGWDNATWPPFGTDDPECMPVKRGHVVAGVVFKEGFPDAQGRAWNRDSADVARITLQRPFRVAIQADVLLHS